MRKGTIAENLRAVRERIVTGCSACGRDPDGVALLAVSKTRPAKDLRAAFDAGQSRFGENYLQEAMEKQAQLADLPIEWHFIGPLQSNKTRAVAERFDWMHSVERLKIAQRLSAQRPGEMPPLNICLQVNIDGEESKSGLAPAELSAVAKAVAELPKLQLRGLMAIPAPREDADKQRESFEQLAQLLEQLRTELPEQPLDTLSMGMSGDLEAAIASGASIVRVGTDIFGPRK
ncbi:YggS family pyridoxal phosphate-dependent enzyme [Microbulbifer halophilus]|uniref:Pyridoxal phosphate homeostasis protein n=1 Tax=Microbulbifer halophilus TaxID=453963 RepID=A0ABW5EEU2_9GAMM|nr:YggS family pyridoxal phosphate-dependent enzyme [Microbulbifer halophilus]MCW8126645.1 YggS family pyridoxal phosphate-dependent enzyme [Microbulbifer halophilus]